MCEPITGLQQLVYNSLKGGRLSVYTYAMEMLETNSDFDAYACSIFGALGQ